ncbi:hypothetical protein GWI33_008449 [Rhynchophorus ferrugineus]|uniref:Carboxylic ester hydrolase n=1 Tax=Rhynchophorus ferrugineus TaxID=354439 RepID=A0A834MC83_RHYFE|nr:hypothetical protein GWI33_008449 [Rhynchophorus ferrugineus]
MSRLRLGIGFEQSSINIEATNSWKRTPTLYLGGPQGVNGIIIDIPDGKIEGITNKTRAGTTYHSFLAIRYAQPPVGLLRFQPPHLVTPWNDTYDATIEKHICYQVNADSLKENEDCLFVNVFTPKNLTKYPIDSNLTVMVWIHGGGFIQGTGYTIGGVGPKFFMDENVILVAFNYRLGPFGFLSTGDDVITGNLGLKDQMFALKWVQKNIQYFGGDSEKVTIFGQSAGSASVAYQLLSPQSKGLYRAAILESGSALSPWAYQRYAKNISYLTAKYIDADFNGSNSEELLDFLMAVPASSIDKASATLNSEYETPYNFQISKGFFYAPVIEHEHEGAFLSEPMYELFEFGRYNNVPVIIGMNAEESLGLLEQNLTNLWKAYDDHPEVLVPFDMHVNDEKLTQVLGQKIYEFFSEGSSFESSLANSIKYHSVQDFDKAQLKQAELMAKHTTVFFYEFVYSGLMGNNLKDRLKGTGNVTHAEELNYMFSNWYSDDIPDNTNLSYFPDSDIKVHNNMMSLWTSFAKDLIPRSADNDTVWEPVNMMEFKYLHIDEQLSMFYGHPKSAKYYFWNKFYEQYSLPPLDTF